MEEENKIDILILNIGWLLRLLCILYFAHFIFLFFISKETLDKMTDYISGLNVADPVVNIAYYFLGSGLIKKKEWARKIILIFSYLSCISFIIFIIYTQSVGLISNLIVFLISVILIIFFSNKNVKKRFTWKLDLVNSPNQNVPNG